MNLEALHLRAHALALQAIYRAVIALSLVMGERVGHISGTLSISGTLMGYFSWLGLGVQPVAVGV